MNLKELREKCNVTLTDMAKILEVTKGSYWKLENGESILSIKNALKIANHFHISLDEIYSDLITPEERAEGVTDTMKVAINAMEDNLLIAFRELGEKLGEGAQKGVVQMIQSMVENAK